MADTRVVYSDADTSGCAEGTSRVEHALPGSPADDWSCASATGGEFRAARLPGPPHHSGCRGAERSRLSHRIAPAIVHTFLTHKAATQAQAAARIGGTYGDERQVAFDALRAAGVPQTTRFAAIAEADLYFMGTLGLTYNSPLRFPGNRPTEEARFGMRVARLLAPAPDEGPCRLAPATRPGFDESCVPFAQGPQLRGSDPPSSTPEHQTVAGQGD